MSKSKRGSKVNDRTDEAIDWVNSVGYDLAEQELTEEAMADMAIRAVKEAFEGCQIDRDAVVSAAGAILDIYYDELEESE